jgi:glutamine synthetase
MANKDEKETQKQTMSKEEQIGFHKGSLATLAKEREEMYKIVQVVEQLMQMHIKALKELGVDLEAQAKEVSKKQEETKLQPKGTDKPIDELI